jgi:raffinose/stachyose/melibiose transport system substrate-binding protein
MISTTSPNPTERNTMVHKGLTLGLTIATGLALALAGCSPAPTTPAGTTGTSPTSGSPGGAAQLSGSLEVGVLPAEGPSAYDILVDVGDSIIADNPDVDITYTFANSKVRPMMEQRWRANNPPDLDYFVFNAQVPSTYEFTDKLLDLTPYLAEPLADGSGTWGDSFLDSTASVTSLDGATYGVVTDTHVITIFYNKAIFDANGLTAPQTWDDLVNAGNVLKAAGIAPIAVTGMYEPYMGFWMDNLFQREVGYEKARAAAFSGDYSDPGYLKAAQKLQEIRDAGFFLSGFQGTDFTATQVEFFQGKAGMIAMGTWLQSEMADSIPEGFQLGVTGFPTIPGAAGDQDAQLAHNNIMVANKASANLDLALEYMRRVTSQEVQTTRAEIGTISAVKGVPIPEGIDGLEAVLTGTSALNVRYFGLEFMPDRFTAYYREVAKFFFGEYDAQQFLDALSDAMKRLPQ